MADIKTKEDLATASEPLIQPEQPAGRDRPATPVLILPPPRRTFTQSIELFLFDRENGTVMGRTPKSWCFLIMFYIFFYACLGMLVRLCFEGLMLTIDHLVPTYTLDRSHIGASPGLAYRPMSQNNEKGANLIWFKTNENQSMAYWIESLNNFLEPYEHSNNNTLEHNYYNCSYTDLPPEGKVCVVDTLNWGPCSSGNNFDFGNGTPCIFLKLNKIFYWKPDYHDVSALPDAMPSELVDHIKMLNESDPMQLTTVWVSCAGEKAFDQENIGPIEYIPNHGFPGYYYPYTNIKGYLSPLVAVHFVKPKRNVIIGVECKVWARNIVHNRHEQRGNIIFHLMID